MVDQTSIIIFDDVQHISQLSYDIIPRNVPIRLKRSFYRDVAMWNHIAFD